MYGGAPQRSVELRRNRSESVFHNMNPVSEAYVFSWGSSGGEHLGPLLGFYPLSLEVYMCCTLVLPSVFLALGRGLSLSKTDVLLLEQRHAGGQRDFHKLGKNNKIKQGILTSRTSVSLGL